MDETWVQDTSPWIQYDLNNWEPMIRNQKPVFYKKKSFLFHQNDAAAFTYIVKSGRIRVTAFHSDGMEKQLYIAETGCCIGEISCIMGLPHTDSATAIVDSFVYRVSSQELIETIRTNWDINKRIFNSVFRKTSVFQNQILELSFSQAIKRTANLLLNLCRQYGVTCPDGCKINIPFTHSDVASMINVSRVTVNNTFLWFAKNGYLKKQGRFVIILSLPKLLELAECEEVLTLN